jgi:DNA-binding NarL/FixJ family response regulator
MFILIFIEFRDIILLARNLHQYIAMNMIIISRDEELLQMTTQMAETKTLGVQVINHSSDPLDIMAAVCSHKPALLLLDDDFLKPNSAHTLASIRKVNENIDIIFVTSDSGIELGRAVSQLGIHYYGLKPLEVSEIEDAVHSLIKLKIQQH